MKLFTNEVRTKMKAEGTVAGTIITFVCFFVLMCAAQVGANVLGEVSASTGLSSYTSSGPGTFFGVSALVGAIAAAFVYFSTLTSIVRERRKAKQHV